VTGSTLTLPSIEDTVPDAAVLVASFGW